MKVVSSSPLRTGRLYPHEYPGTKFLEAESTPGYMELSDAPEKIPNDRRWSSHITRFILRQVGTQFKSRHRARQPDRTIP